jgi:hypothetical protein
LRSSYLPLPAYLGSQARDITSNLWTEFFYVVVVQIQSFGLPKQAFYCLNHISSTGLGFLIPANFQKTLETFLKLLRILF